MKNTANLMKHRPEHRDAAEAEARRRRKKTGEDCQWTTVIHEILEKALIG